MLRKAHKSLTINDKGNEIPPTTAKATPSNSATLAKVESYLRFMIQ